MYENLYFNCVLIFAVPLGIISGLFEFPVESVFFINMIAIITLAKVLDLGTDQLSTYVGQTLSALINCSFGSYVDNF